MKEEYKRILPYILKDDNNETFTIRAITGYGTSSNYETNNIVELREQLNEGEACYLEKNFDTLQEAAAYALGMRDALGECDCALISASESSLCWLSDNDRVRWIDRVSVPEYAISLLSECQTKDEFIEAHSQEDYDNIENWRKTYEKELRDNEYLVFNVVEDNAEHPTTSFEMYPVFGKGCDTIKVDIYAINS